MPADEGKAKKPNRSGVPLHVYIPPALDAALEACAAANRRKVTAEVVIALEKHLREGGFWSPGAEGAGS